MKLKSPLRAVLLTVTLVAGIPNEMTAAATLPASVSSSVSSPASAPASTQASTPAAADAWPREMRLSNAAVLIYQPQVNQWVDNRIDFRCALAIKPAGATEETFGVIFASARTKVDKSTRRVVLDDLQIAKSDFPTLPDHGAAYMAELEKQFALGVHSISLDRLKRSPALAAVKPAAVALQNTAPKVFVSNSPAILVPIDGAPALQPVAGNAKFQRVINTRALILQRVVEKDYFIHVFDGWVWSHSIDGPWEQPFLAASGIDAVAKQISANHLVDMLDGGPNASPRPSLANGVPTIYTSTAPTELIVFKGAPDFLPIVGTSLQWATNTTSDVLLDSTSKNYYALFAGRWFSASAMASTWTFVAANALPPDFAKIPAASLAGAVLPTVAGTPQAQQALNENSIAQTASVPLKKGPTFVPKFDGAPQFAPVTGTKLSFAINASVPMIQVGPASFYAVAAGVWFTATKAAGPWAIATSVPDVVYTIPPSSPIYYVIYVRIFDLTPDVVHEGYTPGYLGTAVSASGTVVYGTGYDYKPWIGSAWYPGPSTYGVAATPVYNPYVGFSFGFATGLATPAWTEPYFGGAVFHGSYWGGYPCCASTSANVYRGAGHAKARNGSVANASAARAASSSGSATPTSPAPAPAPQSNAATGNVTRGYDQTSNMLARSAVSANAGPAATGSATVPAASMPPPGASNAWKSDTVDNDHYTDANGNVYRRSGGGWQQQSSTGWGNAPPDTAWADQEAQARDSAADAENSVSVSNSTRFTGQAGDGWTRRDAGNGGYSRTGGASGGISAEYDNYWNTIENNEFNMWDDSFYGAGTVYYGGIGWSGRLPTP
jgi:hypothetical protein